MALRKARATYHCYDDCVMSGCPSHEAVLTLQTTSMAYHFTAKDIDWHFSPAEFEVLQRLMREVNFEAPAAQDRRGQER